MFRIISRHAPAKNIEQEMIAVQSVPEKRLTGSDTRGNGHLTIIERTFQEEEGEPSNPFLPDATLSSGVAAETTARPVLTSLAEDAASLTVGKQESAMGKNNDTSAVGAKLLFGALQVVSLMQLMSDGE